MRMSYWYDYARRQLGFRDYGLLAWLAGARSRSPVRLEKIPPYLEYLGVPNSKKYSFLMSPGTELVNAQADLMVMCSLSCVY